MKKFTIAICFAVLLSGCAAPFYMSKGVVDFRPYTEEGFFISPGMEGFNFKYSPIGVISISFTPGVVTKDGEKTAKQPYKEQRIDAMGYSAQGQAQTQVFGTSENIFRPSAEYMLEQLVEYAKSLGANGLLDYEIQYIYPATKYGVAAGYSQATISAFAVAIEK